MVISRKVISKGDRENAGAWLEAPDWNKRVVRCPELRWRREQSPDSASRRDGLCRRRGTGDRQAVWVNDSGDAGARERGAVVLWLWCSGKLDVESTCVDDACDTLPVEHIRCVATSTFRCSFIQCSLVRRSCSSARWSVTWCP